MATITSAASGNWSNTATWVGGVVPTAADDAVIVSGHVIQADVDIVVLSISKTNNAGRVVVSTSREITCSGAGLVYTGGGAANGIITVTALVGNVVNIYSDITNNNGSGGNIIVQVIGTATVNVVGVVTSNGAFNSDCITLADNTNVNVVGQVVGGQNGNAFTIRALAPNTSINVTGIVTARAATAPIFGTTSGTVIVNGVINGSASIVAIISTSTAPVIIGGVIVNASNRLAVNAPLIQLLDGVDTRWEFQSSSAPSIVNLYTAGLLTGYPLEAKVEDGTVYGPSSEFEGTLEPVNVDTAQLAEDLLNEISTSSNALAERLRNVSTVQTTGTQISALTLT